MLKNGGKLFQLKHLQRLRDKNACWVELPEKYLLRFLIQHRNSNFVFSSNYYHDIAIINRKEYLIGMKSIDKTVGNLEIDLRKGQSERYFLIDVD